jgi:hypothetical protein
MTPVRPNLGVPFKRLRFLTVLASDSIETGLLGPEKCPILTAFLRACQAIYLVSYSFYAVWNCRLNRNRRKWVGGVGLRRLSGGKLDVSRGPM